MQEVVKTCICRKTQSVPPPEKTQGWISLSFFLCNFLCNFFVQFFSVQLFRLRINIIKVCKGANKGHLGGLDKVFKIRDHHHRIHRQILRPNEGLILILAQS